MRTKSSSSPQLSAALRSLGLLILAGKAFSQINENIGQPYQMQTQPANPGDPVAEVVVDKEGVELLWRTHFGFSNSTVGRTDTDGDGVGDADESDHWTDPWTADAALVGTGSPELRRQAAIESMVGTQFLVDGLPSTPAQVLEREHEVNEPLRQQSSADAVAAAGRVADWEQRTRNSRNGVPGAIVVDVNGDSPVIQANQGMVSNLNSRLIPLWPHNPTIPDSGSLMSGPGYTGNLWYYIVDPDPNVDYRKFCGLWETHAPLGTHQELASRILVGDNAGFDDAGTKHATSVAGIIGAAGISASFRGAAYDCRVAAYNLIANWSEIQGLPRLPANANSPICIRDMRASNHSYGTPCGWGEPSYPDKLRLWHGDISLAAGQNPPQDYKFGSYDAGAQAADITARMQPYHLIVVAAGNDRGDKPKGGTIAYLMKDGGRVGDNSGWDAWFLAKKLFGTVEVDVYVSAELNKYVLKTSLADANWGTDKQTGGNIDNDGFSNQEDDDVDGDGLKNGPDGPDTDNDGDGTLNSDENMTQVNGVPLVGILFPDAGVFDLPGLDLFEDDGNYWFGADTLPGGHTVSKNALCVGAIAGTTAPATYSSFGPTDDGRLKPDIVAQGGDTGLPRPLNPDGSGTGNYEPPLQVLSSTATFSPAYGSGFGTSIAAPVVAGAVTLLSELQENMRGIVDPFRSSTFKALLCHTARDIDPPGPDFQTGYGEIDAANAAVMIRDNYPLRRQITEVLLTPSSTVASIILNAVGPDTPIKVTIAWTDLEGISQPAVVHSLNNLSAPVLRNNINLTVRKIGPPSVTYYPWTPDPSSPWPSTAGTGVNHRDNVEQVLIPAGIVTNGEYEIKIMPQPYGLVGSQWVSVAISGLNLPSGPAEGTILSSGFQTFSGTTHLYTMTFKSAFGGYYKVQYYSYNVNDGWKWRDGTGIIYAKAASTYSGFYVSSTEPNPFPTRVLTIPPDPFAPLPP